MMSIRTKPYAHLNQRQNLKQSLDVALIIEENPLRRRRFRQAGHGHDLAGNDDDKAGAGRKPHLANLYDMPLGCAANGRVRAISL